jgi:uncharacterized membrane protein
MFPNACGAMGVTGWLLMLLLWAGLVALAVWGIARLFPGRPAHPEPTVTRSGRRTPRRHP